MAENPHILGDRGRALEDEFFRKEDQRLVQQLRDAHAATASREALARVSGIKNPAILDRLVELGVRAEGVAALALVPLVEVAWADGSISAEERRAILDRAEKSGIAPGSPDHALLEAWLDRKHSSALFNAWSQMVAGLCEHMTPDQVKALRADLVERARAVASASGGFLGVGKVSAAEADMLQRLEAAFAAK